MKTVKVRIAVAVDHTGAWNSCGWSADQGSQRYDKDAMDNAIDPLEPGEARYWIEAELPIPNDSTTTVQATVTGA